MMQWRQAISLTIFASFFSVASLSNTEKPCDGAQKTQNVGTVLFHGGDMHRKCWEDCAYLLLQARWIAQALIPRGKVNICNEAYINAFISYVENTLEITRGMSTGLAQQMMVDVLADIHGGYLRAVLLPLTREAFYAGTVRYEEAMKLFKLYENLKGVLGTDGSGWQHSLSPSLRQRLAVRQLDLESPHKDCCEKACEDFIPYERCKETKTRDRDTSTTEHCVSPCNELRTAHMPDKCRTKAKCCASTTILIPIPFLDDNHHPHSIAVPLRPLSLHSLFTAKSQSLVTKYYKSAMRCLLAQNSSKQELTDYNRQFRRWLTNAVLPHLHDETFYPAFGSVLRVLETMHGMGFERVDQEMLNSVVDEPTKVNSLRELLKAARLEGQGSWKAFRPGKKSSRHKKTTPGPSDDDELSYTESATDIDEVEECSIRRRLQPSDTDETDDRTDLFNSWAPSVNDGITGKLPRGTMDILLCIILGMLGTLLLWLFCACCYCLISRIRGKRAPECYPKGDRCEVKPLYYGTTAECVPPPAAEPLVQPGYEYSAYDTRPMRSEMTCAPGVCSWSQPMHSESYQQATCRVIMMPSQEAAPRREEPVPRHEEPEPVPPLPEDAEILEPPPVAKGSLYGEPPPFRGSSIKSLRDYEELPLKIKRPPSIRHVPTPVEPSPPQSPPPRDSVYHYPSMKQSMYNPAQRGKTLGVIESMQSLTDAQGSSDLHQYDPNAPRYTQRQSSMYRGTRKTLAQQVKAPRQSNMPLGSW